MDIITKTGEIWSENAIGAVISIIKESDDSIEAERKLTHWLTEMITIRNRFGRTATVAQYSMEANSIEQVQ